MPTYKRLPRFNRDWDKLSDDEKKRFLQAASAFRSDLTRGKGFRPGLRVKQIQGSKRAIWELTWAPDGRATWEYGSEVLRGEPHIIWRRIGTHDIFREP